MSFAPDTPLSFRFARMNVRLQFCPLLLALLAAAPAAHAQLLNRGRDNAAAVLEGNATAAQGVRAGACLRPIGAIGSEEFTVYLMLPKSKIEGFVVELSGSKGAPGEVVANAGIVSFDDGKPAVRGNLGEGWMADAYRRAIEGIMARPLEEVGSYEAALAKVPTIRCRMPNWPN